MSDNQRRTTNQTGRPSEHRPAAKGRTASGQTARKKRRRRRGGALWLLIVLAAAIAIFLIACGVARKQVQQEEVLGEEIAVNIPAGATVGEVIDLLQENDLIGNTLVFKLESKLRGFDGVDLQGTYVFREGMDNESIIRVLEAMPEREQVTLTIPEGYTAENIAARVEELGICSAESFMAAANSRDYDYDFVADLPDRPVLLEGYLFPETYFFYKDTPGHDVVDRLLGQFVTVMDQYETELSNSGYTLDEIVTVASLVQSEIQLDSERATCAGVIYNRLEAGMRLQIDATVLYAQGIVKEDVTYADLEFDSPYNTYQYDGLPLGPISNPGEASLMAALYPEDHDYLYYVLKERGGSEHVFTASYEEFEKAKEAYKNS